MSKKSPDVETPGADESPSPDVAALLQRIAALEKLTGAQAVALNQAPQEIDTPHGIVHKRNSKHMHLTTAELAKMVKAGEAEVTEQAVLCKDGWYSNPYWKAVA